MGHLCRQLGSWDVGTAQPSTVEGSCSGLPSDIVCEQRLVQLASQRRTRVTSRHMGEAHGEGGDAAELITTLNPAYSAVGARQQRRCVGTEFDVLPVDGAAVDAAADKEVVAAPRVVCADAVSRDGPAKLGHGLNGNLVPHTLRPHAHTHRTRITRQRRGRKLVGLRNPGTPRAFVQPSPLLSPTKAVSHFPPNPLPSL